MTQLITKYLKSIVVLHCNNYKELSCEITYICTINEQVKCK